MTNVLERCSRCILPSCYPAISYDQDGECNYCAAWNKKWKHTDFAKQSVVLDRIIDSFRGKTKPYDCVIGLSGGKDSCYVAQVAQQKGLRPLAVTYDNGFLSEAARANIDYTIRALALPHIVFKPDRESLLKWYRHWLLTAGEFCSVCNVGIRSALYRVARNYGIRLIISGTSPRTEAASPSAFFASSYGYVENVARGRFPKNEIRSFQYVTQMKRIRWHLFRKPFYLQLPSFLPWREEDMLKDMKEKLNWQGCSWEQHADCEMNEVKEYLKFKKFGVPEICAKLSALVRDEQLSREKALELLDNHESGLRKQEDRLREKIKERFDMSEVELEQAMKANHIPFIPRSDNIVGVLKRTFYR